MPTGEVAVELLTAVTFQGAHHVESAIRQLAWEPDFYLVNEIEGFRVPAKFKPETMKPRPLKLLKVWTELCRFVLMQLGEFREYGVGFMFSEHTAAAYLYEDREHWLLLNPFRDLKKRNRIWAPSSVNDLRWLYAAAVHECTHLADGLDYHDEAFASALTRNIARTADGFRQVRRIAASVKMNTPIVAGASPVV